MLNNINSLLTIFLKIGVLAAVTGLIIYGIKDEQTGPFPYEMKLSSTEPITNDSLEFRLSIVPALKDKCRDNVPPGLARGIDLSYYQNNLIDKIDSSDSIDFVYCRATHGLNTLDTSFQRNWNTAKQKGIRRGAYHYFEPDQDPVDQAVRFCRIIGPLEEGDMPPALDIEVTGKFSRSKAAALREKVLVWLELTELITKKRPVIYTYYHFANDFLSDDELGEYPLWVARYPESENPIKDRVDADLIPDGWDEWTLWQYSESACIGNIPVCLDVFNGNKKELEQWVLDNNVSYSPFKNNGYAAL